MKFLLPIAVILSTAAAPPDAPVRRAITAAMDDSAARWNSGNLDRFVAIYADDALFATRIGVVTGKRAISARYAGSFAGRGNRRGRLTFVPLAWRAIDPSHEPFVARYVLTPGGGRPVETGSTTLLFERRGDRWLIVSDHSS